MKGSTEKFKRQYTTEFKNEVTANIIKNGLGGTAKAYGLPLSTLRYWHKTIGNSSKVKNYSGF